MVTPVYPASNNQQAIDLNISNANQFFTILQGGIEDFIPTYEGNGEIPSVAKALNEAAAYKVPLAWQTTGEETDLLQPRIFNEDIYVPLTVPAPFSTAPSNEFWRLYSEKTAQVLIDTLTFTGDGVTTDFSIPSMVVDDPSAYLVSVDGVYQRPTIDYTVNVSTDTLSFTEAPPTTVSDNISVTILGALRGALAEEIYETTADGLANTSDGQFFNVVNTTDPEAFIDLYKNNAGAALLIDTYPNSVAYNNLANTVAYEADLASNAVGDGSDKVAHTGTTDTVSEALNNRVIRVSSRTEMKSYDVPAGYQFSFDGSVWDVFSGTAPESDPLEGIYVNLTNGNHAKRRDSKKADLRWFQAALDGVADDTPSLKAAISLRDTIKGFNGTCRFTETITLEQKTRLEALNDKSSGNGFVTQYLFDPSESVSETTLSANVLAADTTIPLADASGFPVSGYARIGDVFDNEYVKYTGKSGNTLTGVSRGWFGGTQTPTIVIPDVDNQGVDQSSGTTVTQVQNAFELDGVFAGEFGAVAIKHAGGTNEPNVPGPGNAVYLTYTAYSKCINGTSFRNFERCIYSGRSYVTTIVEPVTYFCYVAGQIDIGNGASIKSGDAGRVGSSSLSIDGRVWIFRDGEGATVWGGNYGNGRTNVPFTADGHKGLTIVGCYIESAKRENLIAKNNGSIFWSGGFIKEGFYLGKCESGGRISIDNVVTRDMGYIGGLTVNCVDGEAQVTNHWDFDLGAYQPDRVIVNNKVLESRNPLQNLNLAYETPNVIEKTISAGVTTSFLTVRDVVDGSTPSSGASLRIDYSIRTVGSRSAIERGYLLVSFVHRETIALSVDVQKGSDTSQALSNAGTLSVAFANTTPTGPDNDDQTFDIQVTATPDGTQDSIFTAEYHLMPNFTETVTISEP